MTLGPKASKTLQASRARYCCSAADVKVTSTLAKCVIYTTAEKLVPLKDRYLVIHGLVVESG